MRRITTLFVLTGVLAVAGASARSKVADDKYWPQWRGPLANGVAPQGDPPVEWAADKNIRWKGCFAGNDLYLRGRKHLYRISKN